jgi:DNA-binding transcriptional regulator YhcF (GntR family)
MEVGVIEFHLERRSGLATYRQLELQVKQALRVGILRPGDQLPAAREVVEALAINPNTVLKAYRELEREGLVEGRPGQGTFVRRGLPGPVLGDDSLLRQELRRWVRKARDAGLEAEDMRAVLDHTIRDLLQEGVA